MSPSRTEVKFTPSLTEQYKSLQIANLSGSLRALSKI
jgi:hypothetical protein